jgi:hypothetical protein
MWFKWVIVFWFAVEAVVYFAESKGKKFTQPSSKTSLATAVVSILMAIGVLLFIK